MMAPHQNEAGAHPPGVRPAGIPLVHDDHLHGGLHLEGDDAALLPGSDDEEGEEDHVDGVILVNDPRRPVPADPHPAHPPPPPHVAVPPPHPPPPPGPPSRPLSPHDLSRMAEIGAKFDSLGVDLVQHIVAASVPSTAPSSPPPEALGAAPSVPFPPAHLGGASFINLLTTNRETLTMRRLVTKALVDKGNSFNAMIYILPRIPTGVEEFCHTFGAVVDRMIHTTERRADGVDEIVATNVTWGKIVTAYAFGLRLIKASADLRRAEQWQREHLVPEPELQQQQQQQQPQPAIAEEGGEVIPPGTPADFDFRDWGSALGQVMHERMGEWVLSRGGWSDGFNDYFLDRRGLEEAVTKKLFCVFALGVGVALALKLFRR